MKPRINQKCNICQTLLSQEEEWLYNGKWWCSGCKKQDTLNRLDKFIKLNENN